MVTDSNGCTASDTLRIQSVPATGILSFPEKGFLKVFPNPAGDLLHLQFPGGEGEHHRILLLDPLGRKCLGRDVYGTEKTLDLSGLLPGFYILQCISRNGNACRLIIKHE